MGNSPATLSGPRVNLSYDPLEVKIVAADALGDCPGPARPAQALEAPVRLQRRSRRPPIAVATSAEWRISLPSSHPVSCPLGLPQRSGAGATTTRD